VRDYRSIRRWRDVPADLWNNWQWQLKNRIIDADGLKEVANISCGEEDVINQCLKKFRMAITPYYAMLMDPDDPSCPIRRQAVPSVQEFDEYPGDLDDPLDEERSSPVENIVHRYPDRVLFLLTKKCAMYCRHCTRRRTVGEEDFSISTDSFQKAIAYIRERPQIRDVLLSGGDPLLMHDFKLEQIISALREIPHVEIIRIGTRTPVVLPMRINESLLSMLRKYHPIWINTHFNHPAELTPDAIAACARIVDAGIPLGNQSVLLKGVNDDADLLKELFTRLVKYRVRPYYLYQCDPVKGVGHFRTPVSRGIELIGSLRGNISGYAVPTFVIDAPGGGGKIPINPEYLISLDDEKAIMRNYKGEIYMYPNAGEDDDYQYLQEYAFSTAKGRD